MAGGRLNSEHQRSHHEGTKNTKNTKNGSVNEEGRYCSANDPSHPLLALGNIEIDGDKSSISLDSGEDPSNGGPLV